MMFPNVHPKSSIQHREKCQGYLRRNYGDDRLAPKSNGALSEPRPWVNERQLADIGFELTELGERFQAPKH
jgi:hypothetical protein